MKDKIKLTATCPQSLYIVDVTEGPTSTVQGNRAVNIVMLAMGYTAVTELDWAYSGECTAPLTYR